MNAPVKILIIRFSSIGDIVLTTPVIRCVKKQLNNGHNEVHFLTKEGFKGIVEHNPYVDHVKTIQKNTSEIIPRLQQEGYDYIFDLHKNLRSAQIKRALKTLSFSFEKYNFEKWLLVNFNINKMPDMHIVDRYMETTKAFNIKNDNEGLDYFIPNTDQNAVSQLPEGFQENYTVYAIGGQHEGKILPTHKIIELCGMIQTPVVLAGGPEDAERGDEIASHHKHHVYNACGKFTLHGSAQLIKNARAVITHDTGLMHIAAALKKKVISLWGATVPEFGMYPYMPGEGSKIIEPKNVKNRPYSKLGDRKWYKKKFTGMEKIDLNEVVKALD